MTSHVASAPSRFSAVSCRDGSGSASRRPGVSTRKTVRAAPLVRAGSRYRSAALMKAGSQTTTYPSTKNTR
ncbi:MAG: hypothetical protein BWY94_02272 [Actinobacteria bacterium ADurb.BinA094]|nr:MAG: hypothetical protein BWY94_02272 [Actinobacteria bacterium ADurb.BinA094]